jgi:hypothetical protein
MALIVEDGTGLSTAESYISVADANTYIAAYRGANATWDAATEASKEVAARQATKYLDGTNTWKGQKEFSTQSLDWPRIYAYDETGAAYDGIPTALEQATAEVMFLIITGETITETVTRSGQTIREKVDVIEVEYAEGASFQPHYPIVSRLIGDLVAGSSAMGRVVRG